MAQNYFSAFKHLCALGNAYKEFRYNEHPVKLNKFLSTHEISVKDIKATKNWI